MSKKKKLNKDQINMGKKIAKRADKENDIIFNLWKKQDKMTIINDLVNNDKALVRLQLQLLTLASVSQSAGDDYGLKKAGVFIEAGASSRQLVAALREADRQVHQN